MPSFSKLNLTPFYTICLIEDNWILKKLNINLRNIIKHSLIHSLVFDLQSLQLNLIKRLQK